MPRPDRSLTFRASSCCRVAPSHGSQPKQTGPRPRKRCSTAAKIRPRESGFLPSWRSTAKNIPPRSQIKQRSSLASGLAISETTGRGFDWLLLGGTVGM